MKNEITVFFSDSKHALEKPSHCLILFPLPHIHTPCGCKVTFQPLEKLLFNHSVVMLLFNLFFHGQYFSAGVGKQKKSPGKSSLHDTKSLT
jgi:hypothetical protein